LEAEIKEENEKLADFRIAIENITPGKKADELRNHLSKLISEGERKIVRLQEKFNQATEDMKETEEKPEPQPASSEQTTEETSAI
jgi:hypothetical protein